MAFGVSSLNKVILIGRLGADPDVRYTASGVAQGKFNLATTEKWKDQEGGQQEKTEWHRVVTWRRQAEFAGEWLKKGQLVCVEGKLSTRSWEDGGVKKYMTEVTADNITMLGGRGDSQGGGRPTDQGETPPPDKSEDFGPTDDDDDLPF